MNIVLCYPVEPRHVQAIQRAAPDASIISATQQNIPEEILEADIFCGHAKERPVPWEQVVRRGRLKWIQSSAAGLDHCLTSHVVDSSIVVSSASGVLADQVAEHGLAMLLSLLRSLPTFAAAKTRREFIRRPTRDLHRATIGIVGFGGNGRRMAEVLRVFRTRLIATDVFPIDRPEYVDSLWPADKLDDLLAASDIVFLATPLTDATRGMLDRRSFGLIKPGAILINMARGPLVVERDLVEALRSGRLSGAGLDVTEVEPLPAESPLWDMPNVIITPHVGGQSARRIDDMTAFFVENLRRWQTGEPLRNLVDKRLGFPQWIPGGP